MKNCAWCNNANTQNEIILNTWNGSKKEDVVIKYCSDNCRKRIIDYSDFVNKNVKRFFSLILVMVLLIVLLPVIAIVFKVYSAIPVLVGLPTLMLGFIIYKYPIATPETNRKFGLRKSIKILKNIGLVLVVSSIIYISVMLFIY